MPKYTFNRNGIDEVVNGPKTFDTIAQLLREGQSVHVAWTDEAGTRLEILFTIVDLVIGVPTRGIRAKDLYVALQNYGNFHFKVITTPSAPNYIAEKLRYPDRSVGLNRLTTLINAVRHKLASDQIEHD